MKNNYKNMTYVKMAVSLNRHRNAVSAMAHRLGLVKYTHLSDMRWNDEKDDFLRKNYEKSSRDELAKKMGCSSIAIKARLKVLGIKKLWSKLHIPDESKLSDVEKSYIAGLIDGEGCISIHKQKTVKYTSFRPYFGITMNNKEIDTIKHVEKLLKNAGFSLLTRKRNNANATDMYSHTMPSILSLANMIMPFSITKRRQWILVKDFIKSRMEHPMKPYTGIELGIYNQIKEMNLVSRPNGTVFEKVKERNI